MCYQFISQHKLYMSHNIFSVIWVNMTLFELSEF